MCLVSVIIYTNWKTNPKKKNTKNFLNNSRAYVCWHFDAFNSNDTHIGTSIPNCLYACFALQTVFLFRLLMFCQTKILLIELKANFDLELCKTHQVNIEIIIVFMWLRQCLKDLPEMILFLISNKNFLIILASSPPQKVT